MPAPLSTITDIFNSVLYIYLAFCPACYVCWALRGVFSPIHDLLQHSAPLLLQPWPLYHDHPHNLLLFRVLESLHTHQGWHLFVCMCTYAGIIYAAVYICIGLHARILTDPLVLHSLLTIEGYCLMTVGLVVVTSPCGQLLLSDLALQHASTATGSSSIDHWLTTHCT